MREIIITLFVTLCWFKVSARAPEIDSLNKLLATTKEDTTKINTLCKLSFYDQSFQHGLDYAEEALRLARQIKYEKGEADCLHQIGNQYSVINNFALTLQYFLEALKIREYLNDKLGIARSYNAIGYVYIQLEDYKKAIEYCKRADSIKIFDNYRCAINYTQLGQAFLQINQTDSALNYLQRSYEKYNTVKDKYQLNITLDGLGDVQFKMGNNDLAMAYYRQAEKNGVEYKDTFWLSYTYLKTASLYNTVKKTDSAILYAGKSLYYAQAANVLVNIIGSARLLSGLYEGNDKEALHYLRISQAANDSLYSRERTNQIQSMLFSETEREQELAEKKERELEERRENIQYVLIALSIITFIVLFVLLSRSIIVNEKWISFLGILGLLIVFEFINLLVHPFLERITNHTIILMLLALVAIASLLIPLHHKLEHWVKEKMTEKNKKIRLAAAKKTIEKLEGGDK